MCGLWCIVIPGFQWVPYPALILCSIYKLDSVDTGKMKIWFEFPRLREVLELSKSAVARLHGEMHALFVEPNPYLPEIIDQCFVNVLLHRILFIDIAEDFLRSFFQFFIESCKPIFRHSITSKGVWITNLYRLLSKGGVLNWWSILKYVASPQ